jgi:4-amino-4-deoxy-L-arabinose transferase-like glycosyltransferase
LIWILAPIIFFTALFAFFLFITIFKDLNAPPQTGDGPDYDAIGLQISKGSGFSINWDDPDFMAPYLSHNQSGRYDYLIERHGEGPTTYRPPLLPFFMAINYRLFGRSFWPMRVYNSIFLAISCVIVFKILSSRFGLIPGLLSAVLLLVDPRSRYYAPLILTEAAAIFVVAIMCWLLLKTVESKSLRAAIWLGVIMGIAFLLRSIFVLWVPIVAIGIYALGKSRTTSWLSLSAFRLPSLFLVSFIIVAAPWILRNSLVLGGFYPLGTMGSMNLSAGYSDQAVNNRGQWFNLSREGFFDQLNIDNLSLLEQEKLKTEYSRDEAIKWVLSNPMKVPLLMFYKIVGVWIPRGVAAPIILIFATLGFLIIISFRLRFALSMFVLIAACTFAVSVTWTTGDRFLVPILPILSMLAAVGIYYIISFMVEFLSKYP